MSSLLWKYPFHICRPSQIPDQRFGLDLEPEDFVSPLISKALVHHRCPSGYYRPWSSLASQYDSMVSFENNKFETNLDVQQFKPEEICVKVRGDRIIIVEAKHAEKEDDEGYVSRQFKRTYILPKGHDCSKVQTKLSTNGVLTIIVPGINCKTNSRCVPNTHTGEPVKQITEDKKCKL